MIFMASIEKGNATPLISVIMGVYNCADTLAEALECIAVQTYSNWELVICDDGSQDTTWDVATSFERTHPGKVVLLKNEQNMGLNCTLNRCLEYATGSLIARMDGDDRCSPDRLEVELQALIDNPEVDFVSSEMLFFDEHGVWGRTKSKQFPKPRDFIKKTPFCHAPCLVKRTVFDAVEGYSVSKRLLRVEDYHLWVKIYEKGYRGMNIQMPLYQMRDDRDAQSRKKLRYRINEAYVKAYAIKHLKLPVYYYPLCMRPILVGILPSSIYRILHRRKARISVDVDR